MINFALAPSESSAELREAEEQMASEIAIDKIIEELSLRERYQEIFDRAYSLISVETKMPEEGARRDIARSITSIDVSISNIAEVKICKLAELLQGERMQVADLEERLLYILASGERFAFREIRGWFIS